MVNRDQARAAYLAAMPPQDRRQLLAALTEHQRRQLAALGAEARRNGHGRAGPRRVTELDALREALRNPRPVAEVGHAIGLDLNLVATVGELVGALGLPPRTVARWAKSGEVEARKSDNIWILDRLSVEQRAKERP